MLRISFYDQFASCSKHERKICLIYRLKTLRIINNFLKRNKDKEYAPLGGILIMHKLNLKLEIKYLFKHRHENKLYNDAKIVLNSLYGNVQNKC